MISRPRFLLKSKEKMPRQLEANERRGVVVFGSETLDSGVIIGP